MGLAAEHERFGRRPAGFGWLSDSLDRRDLHYAAPLRLLKAAPAAVDFSADFPAPWDQGEIGSCVGQAVAAAVWWARMKAGRRLFMPSRTFTYWGARKIEGTVALDAGCQIRSAIKFTADEGVCPEYMWPYDDVLPADPVTWVFPKRSRAVRTPIDRVMERADDHQAITYARVAQSVGSLRACLAENFPVAFGFMVYSSLYNYDGWPRAELPMPNYSTDHPMGGHAVLMTGYDDGRRAFKCRNSWGVDVQEKGHFWLPYEYAADPALAADFWTIRAMEA